ncbi:MAG: DNA mismatch repair endonuclease MutL [Firmicutes bacterium]|nr:DNA mismatch repair endonuclease MutL [Bacillota bacterium]
MSRIAILAREVANLIAAGEVIERPAAVVKELVENSIDAGASHIDVAFKGNGLELIRVRDNGYGMTQEEALLALHRHATSKISSAADLSAIHSLGFRGEALTSIAAVARLEILTSPADAVAGTLIKVDGGGSPMVETRGAPTGTLITVRDLFFNTPARKKYLKSPRTEASHIVEAVIRLALSHSEVSFNLTRDSRTVFTTTGRGGLGDVIATIFGREVHGELVPLEARSEIVNISGFIGRPTLTRSNRSLQYFMVNNRYVRNPTLVGGVESGYHRLLMTNRYPVVFLNLEIDPEEIDVNVHPTKLEVRFSQERDIRRALHFSVADTLGRHNLIPGMEPKFSPRTRPPAPTAGIKPVLKPLQGSGPKGKVRESSPGIFPPVATFTPRKGEGEYLPADVAASLEDREPNPTFPDLKPLGQVYNSYIIAQGEAGLFLLDQHAAHERILFEDLRRIKGDKGGQDSQNLLVPLTLELSPNEWEMLGQNLPVLRSLGFRIAEFGPRGLIVHSMPTIIPPGKEKDILFQVLGELEEGGDKRPLDELREAIIIVLSCHSAIKAGKRLGQEEMVALMAQLGHTKNPFTCPHGRPTVIHISAGELEKRFKRRQ